MQSILLSDLSAVLECMAAEVLELYGYAAQGT
jgi:hypothetical protein